MIQYLPKSVNHANAECYDTAEKMFGCLEVIQVGGGLLRETRMKYEVVDGILHFFVNYDFFIQEVGQEEAMGKMESHINSEGLGGRMAEKETTKKKDSGNMKKTVVVESVVTVVNAMFQLYMTTTIA